MKTEVLIIGGGFGGTAAAMLLIKEGIKPIIVEQEEFPRFHIGELMTGEAGALLRRLGNPFDAYQRFVEKGTDNLEDMVDLFWEQPFAFAAFVHDRHRLELTDAFAGRIYETEHQPSNAILQFRKLLKRKRDYDHSDDYSIPIGSRYHPERAALWEPDSPVGTTEESISEAAPSKQRLAGAH